MKTLRIRFWVEIGMAILTTILFALTLVWEDWIEKVFRIEPDGGNGSLELLVLSTSLVLTITFFSLARYEWRITQATN